jgi:hypothetical protein
MTKHVSVSLEPGLSALNDSGVLTFHLPREGGIASLEITARATTGAGGSASYGILDSITKVEIRNAYMQTIVDMSAAELYNLNTLITGEAAQLSEGTGAGVVQIVRLPINFGPTKQSELYGLDMSKYPDCELKVHYTLEISGSDGFVTKSFNIDVDARQTDKMEQPAYQGRVRLCLVRGKPTKVQDPDRIKVHSSGKIMGLFLYAYKSGTADNSLVSNVILTTLPDKVKEVQASFSDLQEAHKPLTGSIIDNWLTIWEVPGRHDGQALQPSRIDNAEVQLRELVADGEVKVFMEEIVSN